MKKLLCFALIICCVWGLFGCVQQGDVPENSIAFYYKRAKPTYGAMDSVIAVKYQDTQQYSSNHADLLQQYLLASPGDGFASTFPSGISVVSFQVEALTAKIVLNDRIADLSGMDLTIACICLTQTIMSLTGCQEVIIRAESALLDGQKFITLNRDSYLLMDDSGAASQN